MNPRPDLINPTPTDASEESLGCELVEHNRARQYHRHLCARLPRTVDGRTRYLRSLGYDYFKAQAIAEISRYIDAFTVDGEFFDWREQK